MSIVKARDYDRRQDRYFDLRYRKRRAGGWHVHRRDTGHLLGWLVQTSDGGWEARCGGDPFVPQGMDILDKVRAEDRFAYESRQTGPFAYGVVARGAKRAEAVEGLLVHLLTARALAVQAPDVAATEAAIAAHEALAAEYRQAAAFDFPVGDPARQIMVRAAAQEDADATALRAQLAAAAVSA